MNTILSQLLSILIARLAPELVPIVIRAVAEAIERAVLATPNKYDDAVLMPLVAALRGLCNEQRT